MEYLFKIWKFLPRLMLGFAFFTELYLLIRSNSTSGDIESLFRLLEELRDFSYNSAVIILFFSSAYLGVFLLNGFTSICKAILKKIFVISFKRRFEIFRLSYFELGLKLWERNKSQIEIFYISYSLGLPENFKNYDEAEQKLQKYFTKIEATISKIKNPELAELQTAHNTVTQVQAQSDDQKNSIEMLQQTCVIFFTGVLAYAVFNHSLLLLLIGLAATMLWTLVISFFYIKLKTAYAYRLFIGYIEQFKIDDWTQVEDIIED